MSYPIPKMIKELKEHNNALELSSEYQCILPEVMNEVYSQYVKEEIERLERYLAREDKDDAFVSTTISLPIFNTNKGDRRFLFTNIRNCIKLSLVMHCRLRFYY